MLDVALLGTGGMMPLPNRYLTSLLCRLNGKLLMIDCGECTQVTLRMMGWGFKNIDVICFTHFHADHIAGLPGLLLTIGNSGKTDPLYLYGPPGLYNVVKSLCVIAPDFPYDIIINEFEPKKVQDFCTGGYDISAMPMEHKMPCFSYVLDIPRKPKFDLEKAVSLGLPKQFWSKLQNGAEIEYEGKIYTSDMVMGAPRKGIRVGYCTDSRPVPGISDFIKDADLFICEGIYGEDDKLDKAKEYKHMIFSEAAAIAKRGNAKELWLTHYSPSMTDPRSFIQNASRIFPNTIVAYDRMNKTIFFED